MKRNRFEDFSFSAIIRSKLKSVQYCDYAPSAVVCVKCQLANGCALSIDPTVRKVEKSKKKSSTVAVTTTSGGRVRTTAAPVCCLQCFVFAPTARPTNGESYKFLIFSSTTDLNPDRFTFNINRTTFFSAVSTVFWCDGQNEKSSIALIPT